jgi:hypothetical protein
MPSIFISWCSAWPKNAYIKTPPPIKDGETRRQRNTKQRNRGCSSKDWRAKRCLSRPRTVLHPLQHQHHHHRHEEGVGYLWSMGLWHYLVLFLSYASMFRHHMSCPAWLWCILCNSYVVDLYFTGWSMRCDMLLCSWCMTRCILLPHYLLLVMTKHVCESMRGGWCVLDGVTR